MPSYTYTQNIPAAGNNPSNDQPNMKVNTNSIASIVSVDLYGFNDANGGTHQQVTFPANVTPGAPSGLGSVIYSQPGTADATNSQIYYKNSNLAFLMSGVRAFGFINIASHGTGTFSPDNGFNVSSIVINTSNGTAVVNLSTNAVSGTNYLVILSNSNNTSISKPIISNYSISSATQFTISSVRYDTGGPASPNLLSFVVLQV